MKFSLAHLTALGWPPPTMVRMAAKLGYDFVSLRTIYMGLLNEPNYDLAENRELFRETRKAMKETGLPLHDIELAKIGADTDPRRYLPAFETAAELGCKRVITSVWTPERRLALDLFRALCDQARPLGIRLALEFVTFSDLTSLAEAKEFLREAGRENAGLLIDTLHFHRSRCTLEELRALPPDLLDFVHICDAHAEIPTTREGLVHTARSARQYPGDGDIGLGEIVASMPERVYSIELPNPVWVAVYGREGHARRCLEMAKAYFASQPEGNRRVAP